MSNKPKKTTEQKPMPSNPKSEKPSTTKRESPEEGSRMGGMIGEGRADEGRGGMKGER